MIIFLCQLLLILKCVLLVIAWPLKQHPVFTQDVFRSSYCPTTIPEEYFHHWELDNTPNNDIIIETLSENEQYNTIHELIENATMTVQFEQQTEIIVRCPFGWRPVGPFCTTISFVTPYTQCPLDNQRFNVGPGNPVIPVDHNNNPGICQKIETTGLLLRCPEHFLPQSTLSCPKCRSTAISLECQAIKVQPFILLSDRTTPQCPAGSEPQDNHGGCTALQRLPPNPECPIGYTLTSMITDQYSFLGQHRILCEKTTLIKGKLWCPKGYHLSAEPYRDIPFGDIIREEYQNKIRTVYKETPQSESLLKEGWLHLANFNPLDRVVCFQVLTTLWLHCTENECINDEIRAVKHTLINWAYRQLYTDPDYVVYLAIPTGKDFKFTGSGLRNHY